MNFFSTKQHNLMNTGGAS